MLKSSCLSVWSSAVLFSLVKSLHSKEITGLMPPIYFAYPVGKSKLVQALRNLVIVPIITIVSNTGLSAIAYVR